MMAIISLNPTGNAAPWGRHYGIGPTTVEEFDHLPIEDGWTFELHEGRLIRMPGPGDDHAKISANFYDTVHAYLRSHNLGRLKGTSCYVLKLPNNVDDLLCPDLSYVTPQRASSMPQRGSYRVGAPDLVIEIASPNDYRPQMQNKAAIYLQAGVRLIWVVWPNTQIIDVWRPANLNAPTITLNVADALDGLDVIPGFTCPTQAIFDMAD